MSLVRRASAASGPLGVSGFGATAATCAGGSVLRAVAAGGFCVVLDLGGLRASAACCVVSCSSVCVVFGLVLDALGAVAVAAGCGLSSAFAGLLVGPGWLLGAVVDEAGAVACADVGAAGGVSGGLDGNSLGFEISGASGAALAGGAVEVDVSAFALGRCSDGAGATAPAGLAGDCAGVVSLGFAGAGV